MLAHIKKIGLVNTLKIYILRCLRKLGGLGGSKFKLYFQGLPFTIRVGSSDVSVVEQVFVGEEFDFLRNNNINNIIDLGANIGASAFYFKRMFPEAEIYCVEPDANNFLLLKENTKLLKNVNLICAAIMGASGKVSLKNEVSNEVSKNYEWGYQFKVDPSGIIPGYSFNDFIKLHHITSVDLLKIDVEGAEFEIFNSIKDCDFLKIKIITVEIHSDNKDRNEIVDRMDSLGWKRSVVGELTVFTR